MLECFFIKGILPELATGAVKDTVIERAVKKIMDSMLDKLDRILPRIEADYPCGICGDNCDDHPEDSSENSVCCDNWRSVDSLCVCWDLGQ